MIISISVDHLVLTEYNPTVFHGEVSFTTNVDALVLTEFAADVNPQVHIDITADIDALVLTEYNPVVDFIFDVVASVDVLVITEYSVAIIAGIDIHVNCDSLFITEHIPDISITLPELANEIWSSSLMRKELKATSEMNL